MIIEHICIRSFGKLNNVNVDLGKNVNIINGKNEAGKSTFCNFIKFAFYGTYGTKEERTKYISWATKKASGYIDIALEDGKHYRIDRDVTLIVHDGTQRISNSCAVYDLFNHTRVFDGQVPGEVFFGVNVDIFDSTIFVRQLEENKVGGKDLATSIENMLFAGDEKVNISNALAQLDEVRVKLLYKNEKGGKIFELKQDKGEIELKLAKAQNENTDLIANKNKKIKLEENIKKSEQQLKITNSKIEVYDEYSIKKKMLDKYNNCKLIDQYKLEKQTEKACEEYNNKKIYEDECINALTEAKNKLIDLKARNEAADDVRSKATNDIYKFKEQIEKIESIGNTPEKRSRIINSIEAYNKITSKLRALYIVFFILSVILLGISVTMFILNTFSPITVYILLGVGVLFAIVAIIFVARYAKYNKKFVEQLKKINCKKYSEFVEIKNYVENDSSYLDVITEKKNEADEAFAVANNNYEHAVQAIYNTLDACRFERKSDIFESLSNAIDLCYSKRKRIENLENEIKNQESNNETIDSLLEKYSDSELSEIFKKNFDEEYIKNIDIENLRRNQTFLSVSIPKLKDQLYETNLNIRLLEERGDDPVILSEQLQEINTQLDFNIARYNAIVLAQNAISNASGKLRSGLSPKIAESASQYISALTRGKYSKITMNQNLEMCYEYNNEIHSVETLSAGAGDITYMAMRFALIENLYKKYSPPFVFDESFSRLDDDRLKNILTLLADLSNNGLQLFIFTCHNREENILKNYTPYLVHNIQ